MINVSAIITGHREGLLAGPSINSYLEAVSEAHAHGISVELVVVLDRPDEMTKSMFSDRELPNSRVFFTDFGDPGLARNRGIQECNAECATFLDADDLWGFNWLTEAYREIKRATSPCVLHSELNILFGGGREIWAHVDSESPGFDATYLGIGNYWDALSLAPTEVYRAHPFKPNALDRGYGHEDWHWNCCTILAGIAHRPVTGTVHFKRRRPNSQMAKCEASDVVVWPTGIDTFRVAENLKGARL